MVETTGEHMEPNTQQNTLRSISIYVLIGALLLIAVILGVRWAKARSDGYAKAGQTPAVQQTVSSTPSSPGASQLSNKPSTSSDNQSTPAQPSQPAPKQTPQVAVAPPTPSTSTPAPNPQRMPSTGIEDGILPIGSLVAVVFAALTYIQSRRRLLSPKQPFTF